jgi:hypothetical protein
MNGRISFKNKNPWSVIIRHTRWTHIHWKQIFWAHIHWKHLLVAPFQGELGDTLYRCNSMHGHFGCNTIIHWIVGRQVVKGVVAPSSIAEVGYVVTCVHLIL